MISNRRLRVLHLGKFYPPHMGGIETHLQTLCGELTKSADVKVIVASGSLQSLEGLVDGVSVTRVGTLFSLASAPICLGMVKRIRETKADIVHIHLPNPTGILAYLASGYEGHLIITYHSDVIRQKILGRIFQPILHNALNRCVAIIATSPNYIESSSVLSVYRRLCRVIPYGILVNRFNPYDHAILVKIRERYGPKIIISVGRLIYYKGFEYVIRAMTEVKARLLIIGKGPLLRRLEREVQAQGVGDRIVFLGEIQNQDLAPYYHAADIFVLASIARSEAFGIVQLEAMACGKPVINTRIDSGVPYVSIDGVTGITVQPKDPKALSRAINLLLDNPDLRAKYGEAARQRVQQEFSLEMMVNRTLQLYHEVMN